MKPTMLTYIDEESSALIKILHQYLQKFKPLSDYLATRQIDKIMILATGSSYNAALCARYYFEAHFGILVEIKEPYNFTYYERIDPTTNLVLAISQSGKSASTLSAIKKVQAENIPVFCLTSDVESPVAREADAVLDINTGIESVGFVTRGFSATVLNLLLIALTIARKKGWAGPTQYQAELEQLHALAVAIPAVIEKTEAFIRARQQPLLAASRYVAIGYGALVGVAKEFETKFTETVRQPSSGFELEAYMHGPYLEANKNHLLFFIEDQHNARAAALRNYMAPYVAGVFTVTLNAEAENENTLALNFPAAHNLAPLLLIVPFQLLAYHIATLKGVDLGIRIFDDFDNVLKSKI